MVKIVKEMINDRRRPKYLKRETKRTATYSIEEIKVKCEIYLTNFWLVKTYYIWVYFLIFFSPKIYFTGYNTHLYNIKI